MKKCPDVADTIESSCKFFIYFFVGMGVFAAPYLLLSGNGLSEYQFVNFVVGLVGGLVVGAVVGGLVGICFGVLIFVPIKLYFVLFRRTPISLQGD